MSASTKLSQEVSKKGILDMTRLLIHIFKAVRRVDRTTEEEQGDPITMVATKWRVIVKDQVLLFFVQRVFVAWCWTILVSRPRLLTCVEALLRLLPG